VRDAVAPGVRGVDEPVPVAGIIDFGNPGGGGFGERHDAVGVGQPDDRLRQAGVGGEDGEVGVRVDADDGGVKAVGVAERLHPHGRRRFSGIDQAFARTST
jgi:hypothetical protein